MDFSRRSLMFREFFRMFLSAKRGARLRVSAWPDSGVSRDPYFLFESPRGCPLRCLFTNGPLVWVSLLDFGVLGFLAGYGFGLWLRVLAYVGILRDLFPVFFAGLRNAPLRDMPRHLFISSFSPRRSLYSEASVKNHGKRADRTETRQREISHFAIMKIR